MTERFRFVSEVEEGDLTLSALCRANGISRETGCKWLRRWRDGGLESLVDRSRAPLSHPNALGARVEERIVAARSRHPHWGPKKLRALLEREDPSGAWPAVSTVGQGASAPRSGNAADTAPPRCTVAAARGTFGGGGGQRRVGCGLQGLVAHVRRVEVLFVHAKRRGDAFRAAVPVPAAVRRLQVRPVIKAAMRQWGVPRAIRSGNGPPFVTHGLGGLSQLSVWWIRMGMRHERIEPGSPQQNGCTSACT